MKNSWIFLKNFAILIIIPDNHSTIDKHRFIKKFLLLLH